MSEQKITEDLLGKTNLIEAKGGFEAEPERILQDFEEPDSAIHYHCRGCGTIAELSEKNAQAYLAEENKSLPPVEKGMYIQADGCPCCTALIKNFEVKTVKF